MIQQKRLNYDHLDLLNKKMSERLNNQKAEIKVREFEKDYTKSQSYGYQITRLKPLNLPKKNQQVVLQNVLVYNEGRYRLPGSEFMSHRHFNTNSLKHKRQLSMSNIEEEKQQNDTKRSDAGPSQSANKKKKKSKRKSSRRKILNSNKPLTLCSFFKERNLEPFHPKFLGGTPIGGYDVDYHKKPKIQELKLHDSKTKRSAHRLKLNPFSCDMQESQDHDEIISKNS